MVGLKGFWDSLIDPMPAMLPFKILDYLIKPLSLSMRLFGNIFGAFILMEFIYLVVPIIIPGILGIWFDIFDGILQAVIFTYLSTSYIGEILEGAEAAEEKRHERDKNHHAPQPL
jgi:F-type H+-transporting ATPase subunit a